VAVEAVPARRVATRGARSAGVVEHDAAARGAFGGGFGHHRIRFRQCGLRHARPVFERHHGLTQCRDRGGGRGIRTERLAQAAQRAGVELRHARFVHTEFGADFLHGDFGVVVERHDAAFARRQRVDGSLHAVLHFLTFVGGIGTLGFDRHHHGGQLRFVDVLGTRQRRGLLDRVDAHDHLAQARFIRSHGGGQVGQRRLVAEREAQPFAGGFKLAAHAAHAPRPRVLAQRVDHRSPDAPFGERLELDAARFLEPPRRVDEANHAVLNQVAQVDGVWHGRRHSARQGFHERNASLDAGVDGVGGLLGDHGESSSCVRRSWRTLPLLQSRCQNRATLSRGEHRRAKNGTK